jgi:hypothetical protein
MLLLNFRMLKEKIPLSPQKEEEIVPLKQRDIPLPKGKTVLDYLQHKGPRPWEVSGG